MAASQTRCAPASIHSADAAATATVVAAAVDAVVNVATKEALPIRSGPHSAAFAEHPF